MVNKYIISLLVVNTMTFLPYCSGDLDENMKAVVKMIHDECLSDSGVAAEKLDKIISTKVMEPDPKYMCYLKCTLQQISAMDEDGNVDQEVFIGTMPEEFKSYAIEVSKVCKDISGADPCEKAYNLNACAQKVDPSKYMFL